MLQFKGNCDFNAIISGTSCNTSAFTCMWLLDSETYCCEKIQCSIPSFSTSKTCKITCDSETGLHHCIINYDSSNISIVKQTYINITFANNDWYHCRCDPVTNTNTTFANNHTYLPNWYPCGCNPGNFTPINCSILRPTPTTLVIPFPTTTNTSIASIVVPVVTVTILLCISIATGGALLCACMKKRKQDLATLHSDSKDQQKYNA